MTELLDIQANLQTFLDELATLSALDGRTTSLETRMGAAELALPNKQAHHANLDALSGKAAADINLPAITPDTFLHAKTDGTGYEAKTADEIRTLIGSSSDVASRTALKALATTSNKVAYLTEAGREGWFMWRTGDFSAHIAADTQEGVYVKADAVLATAGAWVRHFNGRLNVQWFGAVADDTTDCTAAFQTAINVALLAGPRSIHIPGKNLPYWFANASAELDVGLGGLAFVGDGMDTSILHFEEGSSTVSFTAPGYKSLFKNAANTAGKQSIIFEELQFKGTLAGDPGRHGGVPVWLDYYKNVTFRACKFYSLTGMAMDIHFCQRAEVVGCWFEDIAADGPRIRDTPNVIVDGNYILRNGDDAIAIHTSDGSATGTREGVIVTNNHLVNAGCIKILAGRVVHVVNNRIELGNLSAIQVLTAAGGSEGNYPIRDIVIANNIILDMMYGNGALTGQLASGIIVRGGVAVGQASTNNTRPGRYDTTGAAWVYPWNYDEVDVDAPTSVVPTINGVRISGNIMRRSRPNVAAYSSYGFGTRLWQGVGYDPAVTDTHLIAGFGINIGGSLTDVLVTENILDCVANAINMDAPTYNDQYERVVIARNILRDNLNRSILINSASFSVDITIEDNEIDGDPYRRNANSNLNGTYVANSVPRGVDLGNLTGVKIRRNRFRNVCQAVAANLPAGNFFDSNLLICAPSALNFSTSNKGIGFVELPDGRFLYEIIDADPTSATYGAVTNAQAIAAGTMPTSGFYVAGAFVKNGNPGGFPGVLGWIRTSTGSGHSLNADWRIVYYDLLTEAGRGIGYNTGAGGAVTQATSKATGVTLNKPSGQITLNAAALANGAGVSFVLTNSTITADDVLVLNHISGGTAGAYTLNARCAAGSATIDVRNVSAGSLSEAIVLQFALIQGASA
ncbi:right-handed parallel beta-helix repeat-containing protein [Mesorhizobium sp.]|uniref:right-handed parallel beta-helix repeat-containing protein n=1 Tax=Mesorhizobium sp. TaxID=1871066 RepID=UPI0025F2D8B3|nr:right-handed parallel beta-helix repeat-containing protein [Mesorhizobium sp.]